jgi:IS30 family transposase
LGIRNRTREGMKVVESKAWLRGKRPKLTVKQEAHLNKLHASNECSTRELAELISVGRFTVYRAIRRAEPKLSGS